MTAAIIIWLLVVVVLIGIGICSNSTTGRRK